MSFELNDANAYLQHLQRQHVNHEIYSTAQDLLADFATRKIARDFAVQFRQARERDYAQLQQIITVAYNGRYANNADKQVASFGEVDNTGRIRTVVATLQEDDSAIMATLRLAGEEIEMFTFFERINEKWPHEDKNLTPYEFERLAFHPVFDVWRDDDKRGEVLRGLIATALAGLDLDQVWLGCTMSPNVKAFMDRVGIQTRAITGVRLADNEQTRFLRAHWPRYFASARPYEVMWP